ncbi:hypothetical protein Pint_21583 [Pistacia integerrima]|uniref:Uncharacterized protein n=1 Tax=Pistacia integerrima TaxID=434235 RepID=A0ACC0XCC2_9ROSI|nr:hypothetical protein Pint_21583 [Pistacia integerrima]
MGSSGGSGGEGGGGGECGVGSIVWVRRRNGSWWPGKILGPEELNTTHLTSPRSGTPVKLLGRDDASVVNVVCFMKFGFVGLLQLLPSSQLKKKSILLLESELWDGGILKALLTSSCAGLLVLGSKDWYNLEKSKRVKAFRCGEFDDCIERAEASQGMPARKREKYARREDAILHALELEKEMLRKQGKLDSSSDARSKSLVSVKKDIVTPSGASDSNGGKSGNSKSNQSSKIIETSPKDEVTDASLNLQKAKDESQPGFEDGHSEVIPRMRGLQDLGLRTATPKRKLSSPSASDGPEKPTVDNNLQTPSCGDPGMGRTSLANGGEQMGGTFRAKRSRYIYLPAESNENLDCKEITPSQTDMSALPVEDSYCGPRIHVEENSSGFMEDDECDSSESESESESEADSSETEPDIDQQMTILSGAAEPREAAYRSQTLGEHGSMSSEEHDHSALSGDISHVHPHDPFSANEAVSKWQLKGKRNIRNITKSSAEASDRRDFNGSIHRTYREEKGAAFTPRASGRSMNSRRKDYFNDALDEVDFDDKDFFSPMVGLDGGYPYMPRAPSRGHNSFNRNILDWDDMAWENQPSSRGHWGHQVERFSPRFFGHYSFGGRPRTMMVDVDLKVQASYPKERVPIVSLMSKLNGKAIIGHPLQIEKVEDGSSDCLIPANEYFGNEAIDHDRTLSPAWRTARRTNLRVPRSHLSSSPNGDLAAESHSFLDDDRRLFKKQNMGNFNHKESVVKKNQSHGPRSAMDKKFPKKQPKKVSLSASQKTRTLSSIAIDHSLSSMTLYDTKSSQMNGLIKPASSGPTTVACIPVKLVFSRLLEKINRPPSRVSSKVVQSSSGAERNPS